MRPVHVLVRAHEAFVPLMERFTLTFRPVCDADQPERRSVFDEVEDVVALRAVAAAEKQDDAAELADSTRRRLCLFSRQLVGVATPHRFDAAVRHDRSQARVISQMTTTGDFATSQSAIPVRL